MLENSGVAAQLAAPQEGLSSMELVRLLYMSVSCGTSVLRIFYHCPVRRNAVQFDK
jgi:hypothetical protein